LQFGFSEFSWVLLAEFYMKLKSIMLAAMLVGSLSSTAYAGTIDGNPTDDIILIANNPAVPNFYTGTFGRTPTLEGAFTDVYTFSPSATSGSWASGSLSNVRLQNLGGLNLSSVSLNGNDFVKFGNSYWELSDVSLLAGPLTLTVIGTLNEGGSYSGTLNLLLAPVPEPETYAMMLGGLGLLGFMARRRKNKA
jgi:hypothetical protein